MKVRRGTLGEALALNAGEVTSPTCRADLDDQRCKIDNALEREVAIPRASLSCGAGGGPRLVAGAGSQHCADTVKEIGVADRFAHQENSPIH